MTDKEMIEERGMAKPFTDFEKELLNEIYEGLGIQDWRDECIWKTARVENCAIRLAKKYQPKIPEGSVVLSKEEFEKLKSLYDNSQGAYMTSQIGNLPLTVEGLRKAVDEITRLNRVETELQELNAKYYNEAKDLRREFNRLKAHSNINDEHLHVRIKDQARKETAREIITEIGEYLKRYSHIHKYAEEAKKTEETYADGTLVEMESVWDVITLNKNGYADYDTMNKLQDNIENISLSRLLKEFEKDFRLFARNRGIEVEE